MQVKHWLIYGLTCLMILTAYTVHAQKGRGKSMDMNQRVEHLGKKLNLNAEQQGKLKTILTKTREDALVIRKENTTPETRRPKMLELVKSTDQQINGILDPKQQELYKQHKADRKKELKKQRNKKRSELPELEDEGIM